MSFLAFQDHHIGAYVAARARVLIGTVRHKSASVPGPVCIVCAQWTQQLFAAFDQNGPYRCCPPCYRTAAAANFPLLKISKKMHENRLDIRKAAGQSTTTVGSATDGSHRREA